MPRGQTLSSNLNPNVQPIYSFTVNVEIALLLKVHGHHN